MKLLGYFLCNEDRLNIQELHGLQKCTVYVQLQHPIPVIWNITTRKPNFAIYRKPQDPSQYLNHLIITASDNTQLLVGMSKRNVINTTNMSINLEDEIINYL